MGDFRIISGAGNGARRLRAADSRKQAGALERQTLAQERVMRSPLAGLLVIVLSGSCSQVATPTSPSLVARSAESSLEGAAATVVTAAASTVPFNGKLEGIADPPQFEPPPSPFFSAHLLATGNATHLGRFTMDYSHRVNLLTLAGIGTATVTAANGDTLTTTVEGTATPTSSPTAFTVVETHTITGGTGRFAGARGSFVVTRSVDFADPFTAGSIDGELTKY